MRSAMRATVALRRAGVNKSLALHTDQGLMALALHLVDGANRAQREGKRRRCTRMLEDAQALRQYVRDRQVIREANRHW